jgi:hemoglobin-like flavoprotein
VALSPDEVDLLRASLRRLARERDHFSELFYERLFAVAPGTRSLFHAELEPLAGKLMSSLAAAVAELHDLDACAAITHDLALRHVGYGVSPADFDAFNAAVIDTLGVVLGRDFDAEMEQVWRKALASVADGMIAAAWGKAS